MLIFLLANRRVLPSMSSDQEWAKIQEALDPVHLEELAESCRVGPWCRFSLRPGAGWAVLVDVGD